MMSTWWWWKLNLPYNLLDSFWLSDQVNCLLWQAIPSETHIFWPVCMWWPLALTLRRGLWDRTGHLTAEMGDKLVGRLTRPMMSLEAQHLSLRKKQSMHSIIRLIHYAYFRFLTNIRRKRVPGSEPIRDKFWQVIKIRLKRKLWQWTRYYLLHEQNEWFDHKKSDTVCI